MFIYQDRIFDSVFFLSNIHQKIKYKKEDIYLKEDYKKKR